MLNKSPRWRWPCSLYPTKSAIIGFQPVYFRLSLSSSGLCPFLVPHNTTYTVIEQLPYVTGVHKQAYAMNRFL
ncbi:hypothetical protein J6590_013399 [Homalodisca vitripennis]|nr:hypothetical protein J6590_013399 [Homalodisca vitripennis]